MFSAFLQWVFYLHTSHTLTNCDLFLEETNQLWFVKCGLGLSIILFEGFWQEVDWSNPIMASKVWGYPGHKQKLELLTLAENLSAWIDHTIYLFRSRLYIRNQVGIEIIKCIFFVHPPLKNVCTFGMMNFWKYMSLGWAGPDWLLAQPDWMMTSQLGLSLARWTDTAHFDHSQNDHIRHSDQSWPFIAGITWW